MTNKATTALAALAGAATTFGFVGGQAGSSRAIAQAMPIQLPTAEQLRILDHMSLVQTSDGLGGTVTTIRITGANLQLVNGLGATNGNPADPDALDPAQVFTNGAGNLILGYHEDEPTQARLRTGSHNLVVGPRHSYTSFGGATIGQRNDTTAPYAAVTGGRFNVAASFFATVSGGGSNRAEEAEAVVAGGSGNRATGPGSFVAGGRSNTAGGIEATTLGGQFNEATGTHALVSGGFRNMATSNFAAALGGDSNLASGTLATATGGALNSASGASSTVHGGAQNVASGFASSVSGGSSNGAIGNLSSIGGGLQRTVSGVNDWGAGGLFQDF